MLIRLDFFVSWTDWLQILEGNTALIVFKKGTSLLCCTQATVKEKERGICKTYCRFDRVNWGIKLNSLPLLNANLDILENYMNDMDMDYVHNETLK